MTREHEFRMGAGARLGASALAGLLSLAACDAGIETDTVIEDESQELGSGPYYTNVTSQIPGLRGLTGFHVSSADVNGDGYPDLLLYASVPGGSSDTDYRLLINRGGTRFEDFTARSGIRASRRGTNDRRSGFGVFADVDNDGDLDFFSAIYAHRFDSYTDNGDRNDLLLNDGLGHFTLAPNSTFHQEKLWNSASAVFLDYDNDGKLDLFVGNWYNESHSTGQGDQLYRGLGNGAFTNVTSAMGLVTPGARPRYGVTASDINHDGRTDLVASVYCQQPSVHWENRGNSFVSVGATSHLGDNVGPGGTCSWGEIPFDFDNDGDMDFFQLLVHGGEGKARSGLLINNGASVFTSRPFGASIRVSDNDQSHDGDHHVALTDIDNDGLVDIILTESAYPPNFRLYVFGHKADHTFTEVTATSGLANVASEAKQPHNVIPFDFDRDGDEDLLVGFNSVHPVELWRNDVGSKNRWLGVKVNGVAGPAGSNRSGLGARVTVTAGTKTYVREVGSSHGNFGPQRPNELLIGTGSTAPSKVRVEWRNSTGSVDEYDVSGNGYVTLTERPIMCAGASNGWVACRGSGCSVCNEKLSADYPRYLGNHPSCTPNSTCSGSFYPCSASCPAPGPADRCGPAAADNWSGCRGTGCAACTEKLTAYPLYFKNHPGCLPNTSCAGSYSTCSASCPAPTNADRCDGSYGGWRGCRGNGCAVCSDLVKAYPKYFANHPLCSKNDTCAGSYSRCNANCPAPTARDK